MQNEQQDEYQWRQEYEEQNDAYEQCVAEDIQRMQEKEEKEWRRMSLEWEKEQEQRAQQESWWCHMEEKRGRVVEEPDPTLPTCWTVAFRFHLGSSLHKEVRRFDAATATVANLLDFVESHPCLHRIGEVEVHYMGSKLVRSERLLQEVWGGSVVVQRLTMTVSAIS